MSSSGIKSKPVYPGLTPDTSARRHVLVGEGAGHEALKRTLDGLVGTQETDAITVLYTPGGHPEGAQELQDPAYPVPNVADSVHDVVSLLAQTLADAPMGTRLYVAGTEPFLWTIVRAARAHGMAEAATYMEHSGPIGRPVICIHCKTTEWSVSTTIYQCPGCGLNLFVRDHFSRRWGVYQGVCVDAEAPGEVPEAEELDS